MSGAKKIGITEIKTVRIHSFGKCFNLRLGIAKEHWYSYSE